MAALFRRRDRDGRRDDPRLGAVATFWSWWADEGAAATTRAVVDGDPGRVAETLSRHVEAIAPGLAWELGRGTGAAHVLVVTCDGDPELRGTARRWRLSAPPADAVWEFADARLPVADLDGVRLVLDGVELDLGSATAGAYVRGAALDLTVHHPRLADVPEPGRGTAVFLMLNVALGEAAVETWVGAVEPTVLAPLDPVPLAGLRSVVDELRDRFTDDRGDPVWALLDGTAPDGSPVLGMAQVPLRSATAPHLDTHVRLTVPFRDRTPHGLPGDGSLRALRALEDHVTARLGGSGRIVAHETARGVRVLHAYVDGGTPAAEQLRAATSGWDEGRVRIEVTGDPGWELVRHLAG